MAHAVQKRLSCLLGKNQYFSKCKHIWTQNNTPRVFLLDWFQNSTNKRVENGSS